MLCTYNSKMDIAGNRFSLIANHETKEFYFHDGRGHNFDFGIVTSDVNRLHVKSYYNCFIHDGYTEVNYITVQGWSKAPTT